MTPKDQMSLRIDGELPLVGVGLVLEDLGGHVVRGADAGAGQVLRPVQHLRNPEVPQPDPLVTLQEQVLALQVPVQDFLIVQVVDGQALNGESVTVWAIQSRIWDSLKVAPFSLVLLMREYMSPASQ